MSQSETILSLLLKLNAGLLRESRARKVRLRIAEDPRWQKRWQRLREHAFDAAASVDAAPEFRADPQLIGEFVDQQLPHVAARRLEKEAWRNPELLREIAIAFQLTHLPAPHPVVDEIDPAVLPARVAGMLGQTPMNGQRRPMEFANGQEYPLASPVSAPPESSGPTLASESSCEPGRNSMVWLLAIVAGLLLLATASAILVTADFGNGTEAHQARDSGPENEDSSHDNGLPGHRSDHVQSDQSLPSESDEISDPNVDSKGNRVLDPPSELFVEDNSKFEEPLDDSPIEVKTAGSSDDRSRTNESVGDRVAYAPFLPVWNRIEGVIGLRDPATNLTHGYRSENRLTDDIKIQVLPQSWAESEVADLGRLVVDGDSLLRIGHRYESGDAPTDDPAQNRQVEISLAYGRLAISGIAPETRLLVKTGDVRWPVTVIGKNTTLGVEYSNDMARLFVRRGEVFVRGQTLENNHHAIWQRGSFHSPEKTKLDAKWIDRPERYAKIPDRYRKQLLASDNLAKTLGQLRDSKEKAMQIAATNWQWTLQPELFVREFRSGNSVKWAMALQWLFEQPHGNPRSRELWRHLAEASGNTELIRDLARWSNLYSRGDLPTPAQLERMAARLANDQLFVRFVAAYVLEYYFGNPYGYQPAAPANARARQTRAWRHHINEAYHRLIQQRIGNQ